MAYTLSQLQALEAAIASGHKRVTYDGKTVEYQTTEDMWKAYNRIRDELINAGLITPPANDRGRTTLVEFSRE
jgi:hypothetical protein